MVIILNRKNHKYMAHSQQIHFCKMVRKKFPQFFSRVFALDIGSLDINGNNQYLFDSDCLYLGLDLAPGRNVDLITPAHNLKLPDCTFDVIISTECLEHDKFYIKTLNNIVRLLKPGGLFLMSCATTGRPEHGTKRTTPQDAPLLFEIDPEWADYYKNINEEDVRRAIPVDEIFCNYDFLIGEETHDLYFWGIKSGTFVKRENTSWLLDSNPVQANLFALRTELESERSTNLALRTELESERSTNLALRAELERVYGSRSWRITMPLRKIMSRLERIIVFSKKFYGASRYVMRGDLNGLRLRLLAERQNKQEIKLISAIKYNDADKINLCIVATKHTLFVANLVAERLKYHGVNAIIQTKLPEKHTHAMYLIICPQMFDNLPPGEKRIVFQMEQSVSSRWFSVEYLNILKNSLAVIDYSLDNIAFLDTKGISYPQINYVPIGATKKYYSNLAELPKKCDVLFYGDANSSPRRQRMLAILQKHFSVRICSEVFGSDIIQAIKETRVVVNIHYYENALLEMPRIAECLSFGVHVISESTKDQENYPEIKNCVTFFEENNDYAMIAAVRYALDHSNHTNLLEKSLNLSSNRFNFMFDRFLVNMGFIDIDRISSGPLPISLNCGLIALSMPETIKRRLVFEGNKPKSCEIFDGLRFKPGWVGCGLSYKFLALNALRNGVGRLTILEDDVLLPQDFDDKICIIHEYLDKIEGNWDLFAGVIANLNENTKILHVEEYSGILFITIDKMTSMVCNIYSKRIMKLLAEWNHSDLNDQNNTIDRYLERQSNLRIVVTIPFLVGHREEVHSTLWGFQNIQYADMIKDSAKSLQDKLRNHIN